MADDALLSASLAAGEADLPRCSSGRRWSADLPQGTSAAWPSDCRCGKEGPTRPVNMISSALDRLADSSYEVVIGGHSCRERLSPRRAVPGARGCLNHQSTADLIQSRPVVPGVAWWPWRMTRKEQAGGPRSNASDIGVVRVFSNPGPDAEDRLRRLISLMVRYATQDKVAPVSNSCLDEPQDDAIEKDSSSQDALIRGRLARYSSTQYEGGKVGLNIKNEETCRLAGELAHLTGETMTGAITVALKERLGRERSERSAEARVQRLLAIGRRCASMMGDGPSAVEHGDFLYDERGLPK